MNGTEQRTHRTVTQAHAQRLDDLGVALEGVETSSVKRDHILRDAYEQATEAVNAERTHRLKLADEQRAYVDGELRAVRQCCADRGAAFHNFETQTFWQRLRWLTRGSQNG